MSRREIEWKAFSIDELFDICTGRDIIIGDTEEGRIPLVSHQNTDNGIVKRIKRIPNRRLFNHKSTIALADRGVFWASVQDEDFQIGTRVKALSLKSGETNKEVLLFFATAINKLQVMFKEYLVNATDKLPELKIMLPIKEDRIDYTYMQEHIKELEQEHIKELEQYLIASGLIDYKLSKEDLSIYNRTPLFKIFNVERLFGKSTRGKRLKSLDRIPGELPFVTAGEADEGISDYIGNDVEVFESNTSTIDMFGSAKYRGYRYGGDDHIAIVHTEKLTEGAAKYVTSALHKAAHTGLFSYMNNFYAKDADALNISLPIALDVDGTPLIEMGDGKYTYHDDGYIPDWEYMEKYIRVIEKKVIADVVKYKDQVIDVTRKVVSG